MTSKMQATLILTDITRSAVRGERKKEPLRMIMIASLTFRPRAPNINVALLLSVLTVRKKEPFMLGRRRRAMAINIEIGGMGAYLRRLSFLIVVLFFARPGLGITLCR